MRLIIEPEVVHTRVEPVTCGTLNIRRTPWGNSGEFPLTQGKLVCRLAAIRSVGRPVGSETLSRFRKTWELKLGRVGPQYPFSSNR